MTILHRLAESNQRLAPALLSIGCRSKDEAIYKQDLSDWEREDVVALRFAYSRPIAGSKESKYVQDRIWEDRKRLVELWRIRGTVYICGGPPVV
jgi:cytochrome P450/NADPH-cytochrome P450 reductase